MLAGKEEAGYEALGKAVQMSLFLMCDYAGPIYLTVRHLGLGGTAHHYRSPASFTGLSYQRKKCS